MSVPELRAEIGTNLAAVRERIASAATWAGRAPSEVRLVAIAKYQPAKLIRAAADEGHVDFGENFAPELAEKAPSLADLTGARWHVVGPVAADEVQTLAAQADVFHALADAVTAQSLGELRDVRPLECFIEVNVAGREGVAGVSFDDAPRVVDACRGVDGIALVGLMCLVPADLGADGESSRPYFARLRALGEELGLERLSMGITTDFEAAIEEGATDVRVGRAVFGIRHAQLEGTPYAHLQEPG